MDAHRAPASGASHPVAPDDGPYLGGLEDVTEEEIIKNIRDYPFVMGKLKDC